MQRGKTRSGRGMTRRRFIEIAAAAGAVALAGCGDDDPALSTCAVSAAEPIDLPAGDLFGLGVASGDPLHDRIILWTRLYAPAGESLPARDIPVHWEIATDAALTQTVSCGTEVARSQFAHAVHADAGGLSPSTTYWYRFRVGDRLSPIARTRTWPAPGTLPEGVRFAFASCQRWEEGFYNAYPHLLAEDGVEFVVWLGDYIYETSQDGVRPTDFGEATTLADYRFLYSMYKGDANLRAAHHAFPWIVTWDDHEFVDDYVGDGAEDDLARNDPVLRAAQRQRRFEAYQAWWEHQPVRLPAPTGPEYRIYRSISYGDLARFQVLDTRQYRSRLECYYDTIGPRCEGSPAPDTKMLGDEQQQWLFDNLQQSPALWNVLAQGVVMTETPALLSGTTRWFNYDQWDAFVADRQRLFDFLHERAVRNLVVLTGDIHMAGAADLKLDFANPDSTTLGSELVCSSISGDFPPLFFGLIESSARRTPHIKYVNPRKRGYVVCDVTRERWTATFRALDTVKEPQSGIITDATFRLTAGIPGVVRV